MARTASPSLSEIVASDPGCLLLPTEACALLPRPPGKTPPHPSIISRWSRSGIVAPSGRVVRLRTGRVGRRLVVRAADLAKFFEEAGEAGGTR